MSEKPLSILHADDDPDDLELWEETLLSLEPDASIKQVVNGREVKNYLMNCPDKDLPSLVILDYNMPEMTGAEVLSWLSGQSRYRSIHKLILSTSGADVHKKNCIRDGAEAYFVKPVNLRELETLAKKMLAIASKS